MDIIQNIYFVVLSSAIAFAYTGYAIWIVIEELKLFNKIKILYRERQYCHFELYKNGFQSKEELEGKFQIRVNCYIVGLSLSALFAVGVNLHVAFDNHMLHDKIIYLLLTYFLVFLII